jgi:hypothetical protein
MLLERSDLEIGLKSFEVVLAELAEQKVLHGALPRKGGSAKNSQLSVPYWIPDNASIVGALPHIASFNFAV